MGIEMRKYHDTVKIAEDIIQNENVGWIEAIARAKIIVDIDKGIERVLNGDNACACIENKNKL